MKTIFLSLFTLILCLNARAANPVFGNPFKDVDMAKAAIARFLPKGVLLEISSTDRLAITMSGHRVCNPIAWKYTFAMPAQTEGDRHLTAVVSVFDEGYAVFDEGKMKIKCVPETHFVIKDEHPIGRSEITQEQLAQVLPIDQTITAANTKGLVNVKDVSVVRSFGPERNGISYHFEGTDAEGKAIEMPVIVDAVTGKAF